MPSTAAATSVADLMSSPPVTAKASESLEAACERMVGHGVGSVVVVEGDVCTGVLTERDVLRAHAAGAAHATVGEWMTADPVVVRPSTSWNEASDRIRRGGFRHLPVVDDDERLVGLVSLRDLTRVLYLLAADAAEGVKEAPAGLEGVAVARTLLSDVRGREGFYHYRGYDATQIARLGTVEDAWHLLHEGDLPTAGQRDAFAAKVRAAREVPVELAAMLPPIAGSGAPGSLEPLQAAVAAAGAVLGYGSWLDQDLEATREQTLRVAALVPVLSASLYRLALERDPVAPRDDLAYAANYLWMVTGTEPDAAAVGALERYLVATIDHGFNNSTFTARVIASSGAPVASAMAGAMAALSGPLHGGAPAKVHDMLEEIGTPDRAEGYVRAILEKRGRVMGFGHRVYRTLDPRGLLLHDEARRLGGAQVAFAEQVEETVMRLLRELRPGRELYANVEFYAGVVLGLTGLPPEIFAAAFACSRSIGWAANICEQVADNRIVRPLAHYVGPQPPREIPVFWSDDTGRPA